METERAPQNESLNNEAEIQRERDYVKAVFSDPTQKLGKQDAIRVWDESGVMQHERFIYGVYSEQTELEALKHKQRIYDHDGKILFDGSTPKSNLPRGRFDYHGDLELQDELKKAIEADTVEGYEKAVKITEEINKRKSRDIE